MEPFVRATFDMFIRYLYRYLGNEVECEDVLEDVYADIWENPERLRHVSTERELLRTVYMYYMRKRLREVYRRMNRHLYLPQKDLENLTAPELGILETLSQSELEQILRRALGRLKARERTSPGPGPTQGAGAKGDRALDGGVLQQGDCQRASHDGRSGKDAEISNNIEAQEDVE
jgi:hypothetical protein